MEFTLAPDIHKRLKLILQGSTLKYIKPSQIHCFRSYGSKSRARARIWAFPRIWQMALNLPPHYCIEILSEKFDSLKEDDKTRILIHELLHIPHNFSGALIPHGTSRSHYVNSQTVERLFHDYCHSR